MKRAGNSDSKTHVDKPGGTVQKSTVYLGSEYLGLSFLTSLNHQLFKNIAYVGYFGHFVICCICVFVYLWICICVFVYLTVQNIIFDVLGPLAFQKYSIIRVYKVFRAWWRTNDKRQTNNRVNLVQVRSWTMNRADFCNWQHVRYPPHCDTSTWHSHQVGRTQAGWNAKWCAVERQNYNL